MAASYPNSLKSFTRMVDGVDDMEAANVNEAYDEIEAEQNELGTNPRGLYYSDVGALLLAIARKLEAAEQTTPNLTLQVQAGDVYVSGATLVGFAGGNSPSFTAPASNPRIDLLVLNSSGTLERIVGTEAASPSPPTYPTDKLPIAEVYNRVGQTSIKNTNDGSNGYIYKDVRPFLNLGVAGAASTIDQKRIWGCNIKPNSGSPTTKIDVETGVVEVDTIATGSPEVIEVTSALTMDFATTGANGLDTGTPAIGFYHMFTIYNPTTQTVASLSSQNETSPTLPSGYTKLRRVGTFYNTASGSASIRAFNQKGSGTRREYQFDAITVLSNGSATSYTSISLSTVVPATAVGIQGIMQADTYQGRLGISLSDDGTRTVAEGHSGSVNGGYARMSFRMLLSAAQTVYYQVINVGSDKQKLRISGYWEEL